MILPVSSAQAARCSARHAMSTPEPSPAAPPSRGPGRRWSRRRGVSTRHSLSEITSSRSRPWRRQVPNRATAPRRRGPRPPPRSTGKESAPAAPIAIAAVADERRLLMNLRGRPDPTGSISTPLSMNIAADEPRWPTAVGHQLVENTDGGVGVDPAVDLDRQGFSGVFVHDVEQLQPPAVLGLVELVVQRPHVIGVLGGQPVGRAGGAAQSLAFAAPGRHPQAFLAPEPLDGLAVHPPALLHQLGVSPPVAPARVVAAELAELLAQRSVPVWLGR